ncbi:DDB1- and CUL4-associated factor 13 [Parasteatoda tepidariorum]|uniref:DDB1- and CUL4-associated factor 13 n=1 Tax=Parasteatoda tepidariorum TaxID=114398 RepID=UPI001C71B140|nr:DDB1- and CUL4-associated factor 13 [Parasteatoda tepidariorum]
MKVKILSRNPDDYLRETKNDIHKIKRNYDPALHPFDVAREYTRALNAIKLERVLAKPFMYSLDGHNDGIQCMLKHQTSLSLLFSGAYDGEIRMWNLANQKCLKAVQAHDGIVRGLCMPNDGSRLLSVGDDKVVKHWSLEEPALTEPIEAIVMKTVVSGIDHHRKQSMYATCGEKVDIWESTRSEPLRSLTWGVDTVKFIKFNPIEVNIFGCTCSDRSIVLYDVREANPLRKVTMDLCSNAISWNPMEAFVFVSASEDYNLYSFDMRKLTMPLQIHKDHTSAVLDVDYSPTGKEFVSGSYDKTIRIFPQKSGRSRDVYHTKRMQRLTSVLWSLDNKYILTGSDEMNIRMWKAKASEKLGSMSYRERMALNHAEKLKEKFGRHPQVQRIARHRHVPKHVYNAAKEHRTIIESKKRKEANRRAHSKPGTVPYVSERVKHIVQEE